MKEPIRDHITSHSNTGCVTHSMHNVIPGSDRSRTNTTDVSRQSPALRTVSNAALNLFRRCSTHVATKRERLKRKVQPGHDKKTVFPIQVEQGSLQEEMEEVQTVDPGCARSLMKSVSFNKDGYSECHVSDTVYPDDVSYSTLWHSIRYVGKHASQHCP